MEKLSLIAMYVTKLFMYVMKLSLIEKEAI